MLRYVKIDKKINLIYSSNNTTRKKENKKRKKTKLIFSRIASFLDNKKDVFKFPWGQPSGETGVLPDPCGGGTLHGSNVYLIGVGTRSGPTLEEFLVINK